MIPTAEEFLLEYDKKSEGYNEAGVLKDFAKLHVEAFRQELLDEPTYYLEGDEGSERLDAKKIREELYPLTNIK